MAKKYNIHLTSDERDELDDIVKRGKNAARVILLALVLLLADLSSEGRGKMKNYEISQKLNISEKTIESTKKRFVEGGIPLALGRKPMTVNPSRIKFDGEFEARLIALACSDPPSGMARWTVRLLADKLVELGIAPDGVSPMSVHRVLKKTKLNLTKTSTVKFHQNTVANS